MTARPASNLERVGCVGATRAETPHRQVAQVVGPRTLESFEAGICQNCHLAALDESTHSRVHFPILSLATFGNNAVAAFRLGVKPEAERTQEMRG